MLFAGLGSVRIVKNCDLGLENAALGLRRRAAFSRPLHSFSLYGPSSRQITYIFLKSNGGFCVNYPSKFFRSTRDLKIGGYHSDIPSFSREIFSHVTPLQQSRVSKNI